ncbi:MAG: hypothetical protein HC810_06025 [Acaryochloridaceae cyanobacterium RL_2_7]|nr:hypothetical protein [Acaryochloridaceae cyanobacterium RL_2_7]
MYQKVMAQLNDWEEAQWDQGYQLQRLNDKLNAITESLEQTYQNIVEYNFVVDQDIMQRYWDDMDFAQLEVSISPDDFQAQLKVLQQQLYPLDEMDLSQVIGERLQEPLAKAAEKMKVCEQRATQPVEDQAMDEVTQLVTPLLQHLSECEEKLSEFQGMQGGDVQKSIESLEIKLSTVAAHVERLRGYHLSDLARYNELHVKLSMIRFKVEEFQSQVAIELEQIPYLIENHLNQRFPNLLSDPSFEDI